MVFQEVWIDPEYDNVWILMNYQVWCEMGYFFNNNLPYIVGLRQFHTFFFNNDLLPQGDKI